MRPELTKIELVDRYLQGDLTPSEATAFKAQLTTDKELSQLLENQTLILQAVQRKGIKNAVVAFAPTIVSKASIWTRYKWPIILSSIALLLATGISYALFNQESNAKKTANVTAIINDSISKKEFSSGPPIEPLAYQKETVDYTYMPSPVYRKSSTYDQREYEIGGLNTHIRPTIQKETISSNEDHIIEGKDGSLVIIPKNAFVDSLGIPVEGMVNLEIVEALTIDKMIAYNLQTTNGPNALKSGGMIYIQPYQNGSKLSLAKDKAIHIEIPTDDYDSEMMAWEGITTDGNIDWQNPKAIENYLIPIDLASLEFLPKGFRQEVQATLPYKSYNKSSNELEDSLYYSFAANFNSDDDGNTFEFKAKTKDQLPKQETTKLTKMNNNSVNPSNNSSGVNEFPIKIESESVEGEFVTFKFNDIPSSAIANLSIIKSDRDNKKNMVYPFYGNEVKIPREKKYRIIQVNIVGCPATTYYNIIPENNSVELTYGQPECPKEKTEQCYLSPASIYAIKQNQFANTFIATTAFEERIQALHQLPNAQTYLDLYVNQLEKNLWEIDTEIAKKLNGPQKAIFEKFAAEKLTNVRITDQQFDQLKAYYSNQSKEKQKETTAAMKAQSLKSRTELQKINDAISEANTKLITYLNPSTNSSTTSFSAINISLPSRVNRKPKTGRSRNAYKVNWYTTGWVNIDAYLKELDNPLKIEIMVEKKPGMKIYQAVNFVKNIVGLTNQDGKYIAHYPNKTKASANQMKNAFSVGISRIDGDNFYLALKRFNPYQVNQVQLEWEKVNEKEMMRRLKQISTYTKDLVKDLEDESIRIREELRLRERVDALNQERNALLEQQQKELQFIQHLEDFINPCVEKNSSSTNNEPPEIGKDEDANFPGGYAAMSKWISDNLQYPIEAIDYNIQGKIWVSFEVSENGTITNVSIANPDSKLMVLEEEAIRLVQSMPPWNPASEFGKPVATKTKIPITFTLE